MTLFLKVKHLLQEYPILRTSDQNLAWKVWRDEGRVADDNLGGYMPRLAFLQATTYEDIMEAKRKVMKKYPKLAGISPSRSKSEFISHLF